MNPDVRRQVEALDDMTVAELREVYAEVFSEPTRSRHKRYLQKRITWGLQAREQGGLSERARRRARELANEADLRLLAPKERRHAITRPFSPPRDDRLPPPGTVLTRAWKGRTIAITVLDRGFDYEGEVYRSLSAIARIVTGTRWNGYLFFGLTPRKTQHEDA